MKLNEEEAGLLLGFSEGLVKAAKLALTLNRLLLEALLGEPEPPADIGEDARVRMGLEEAADRFLHKMGAK